MEMYMNVSSMVFSEADFTLITRQYNQTVDWLANAKEEQAKLQPYENPSLTVSLVETQRYALESELRYLMSKLKSWRPPPPPVPQTPAQSDSNNTDDKDEETSIDIDDTVDPQQQEPKEIVKEKEETQIEPENTPKEPENIPEEPEITPEAPENILEQSEITPEEPATPPSPDSQPTEHIDL